MYICNEKELRMGIGSNLRSLLDSIPAHVRVVAVSKMRSIGEMMEAYEAGQRAFGENKAQEIVTKHTMMPASAEWHFIGHLQTNKVKYIAPFVSLIHSIDSLRLLEEVNKEAVKNQRTIDCLLQFHIATEESKFGLDLEEAKTILESERVRMLANVRITGVMGMATFSDDETLVRGEFAALKRHFDHLKSQYFAGHPYFKEISMGMSGDYRIAIEEGSTIIRVGTVIFSDEAQVST